MRTTSSTRSAGPCTSGRQLGAVTLTRGALAFEREAQRRQRRADLLLGQCDAGELLDAAEAKGDDRP